MVKRKNFLILSFLFFFCSVILLSEETRTVNYNGRKLSPKSGNFSVIGVKTEADEGDFLLISVYLNDMIDTDSVQNRRIFVDGTPLPAVTQFQFSKNRRQVQFKIKRQTKEEFSLRFVQFKSFDGRVIRQTQLSGLSSGTFFKFSRETREWQKSSL